MFNSGETTARLTINDMHQNAVLTVLGFFDSLYGIKFSLTFTPLQVFNQKRRCREDDHTYGLFRC